MKAEQEESLLQSKSNTNKHHKGDPTTQVKEAATIRTSSKRKYKGKLHGPEKCPTAKSIMNHDQNTMVLSPTKPKGQYGK